MDKIEAANVTEADLPMRAMAAMAAAGEECYEPLRIQSKFSRACRWRYIGYSMILKVLYELYLYIIPLAVSLV